MTVLDARIDPEVRDRALRCDVDWAEAWLGPYAGITAAFPQEAALQMGVTALEVTDHAVLTTPLEPVRRLPAHAAEMVTEVRAGELLRRVVREGDWWLLAGEDDYVGWAHDWVLHPVDPSQHARWFERKLGSYTRPLGTLWLSDHHAATPLVLGTPLLGVDAAVSARGDFLLVSTTTGAEGWLARGELAHDLDQDPATRALTCARMLMGTPYRWGGRSPLGFDCSGLVQFVARLAGVRLPRDAAQQQRVGTAIALDPEQWRAGDLLFFGKRADHVGIYDGRRGMVHCRGTVRRDGLGDLAPLMERLYTVRRPWDRAGSVRDSLWTLGPGSSASAS